MQDQSIMFAVAHTLLLAAIFSWRLIMRLSRIENDHKKN